MCSVETNLKNLGLGGEAPEKILYTNIVCKSNQLKKNIYVFSWNQLKNFDLPFWNQLKILEPLRASSLPYSKQDRCVPSEPT